VFTAGSAPIKVDPNGDFEVEQIYVSYVKLADPKARYPLLLWQWRRPHRRHLWRRSPTVSRVGRCSSCAPGTTSPMPSSVAAPPGARYPEIFTTEPWFRTKRQAWEDFRIGAVGSYRLAPAERVALPGQLFPTEAFDQ
jgi:hypothetical protein